MTCTLVIAATIVVLMLLITAVIVAAPFKKTFSQAAEAPIRGVCYDTGVAPAGTKSLADCIRAEFGAIRAAGFNAVRTYFPMYGTAPPDGDVGNYARLARDAGIRVLLGVGTGFYQQWPASCQAALKAAHDRYPEALLGVEVGNEEVAAGDTAAARKVLALMGGIRTLLGGAVPVGTAQVGSVWLDAAASTLASGADFCGANCYPGSPGPSLATGNPGADSAALAAQLDRLVTAVGPKLWITEYGVPQGGACGGYTFSPAGAAQFHALMAPWLAAHPEVPAFAFMAFDTPSKPSAPGCPSATNTEARMGLPALAGLANGCVRVP